MGSEIEFRGTADSKRPVDSRRLADRRRLADSRNLPETHKETSRKNIHIQRAHPSA